MTPAQLSELAQAAQQAHAEHHSRGSDDYWISVAEAVVQCFKTQLALDTSRAEANQPLK